MTLEALAESLDDLLETPTGCWHTTRRAGRSNARFPARFHRRGSVVVQNRHVPGRSDDEPRPWKKGGLGSCTRRAAASRGTGGGGCTDRAGVGRDAASLASTRSARADDASRDAARASSRVAGTGTRLEGQRIEAATAFYYQVGTGLQSQGGPIDGRKSAMGHQPMASTAAPGDEVSHGFFADVVGVAGAPRLSTASRENESFRETTTVTTSPEFSFGARYGAHAEEQLRSVTAGPILTFRLFEDNTVITAAATVVGDGFDDLRVNGKDKGFLSRTTFSGNFAWSQVLSPTTMFDLSLGVTGSTLAQTWNSVIKYRRKGTRPARASSASASASPTRETGTRSRLASRSTPVTRRSRAYRFYENDVLAHDRLEVSQPDGGLLTGQFRFHACRTSVRPSAARDDPRAATARRSSRADRLAGLAKRPISVRDLTALRHARPNQRAHGADGRIWTGF
jgi:hypothetical protein